MNRWIRIGWVLALGMLVSCAGAENPASSDEGVMPEASSSDVAPDASAELDAMEATCAAEGPAMEARQQAASLFDRLGGEEGIRAVVRDTVRRHLENPEIRDLFADVDSENLIELATQFLVAGTGGPPNAYTGRDMMAAHASLGLTDAHFVSAERDMEQAVRTNGHGDDEIQEVACAFVSFRRDVVTQ